MALRSYESESSVTWYECLTCNRMWHREKAMSPTPFNSRPSKTAAQPS